MPAAFVVLRMPSGGTILGDAIARNPQARVTSVPTGWREGPDGRVMDLIALVEGLPDVALAEVLLAWSRRYGEPAQVLGESFALRLPVRVASVRAPGMASVLHTTEGLPVWGNVAAGDWSEQWMRFPDRPSAELAAAQLRQRLLGIDGLTVRVADPRPDDADCWEVLHAAAGAALHMAAAPAEAALAG